MALEIARLVGNVPLALQVVGSLLKDIDPSIIANDLRRDPIPALSPELLPSTERVFTSLNISYHYLSPEHQKCGRLLALFPGSFDESAVQGILGQELVQDSSKCLRELQYKSLLTYDGRTQRYRYQQLIKEFFSYVSNKHEESNVLNKTFIRRFQEYFSGVGCTNEFEVKGMFHILDVERPNVDFLVSHGLETCPSYAEPQTEFFTNITLTLTEALLKILHICITYKSFHSRYGDLNMRLHLKPMDYNYI